jgi:branched-subunit amino acid ABC-type transport system permease component
MSVVQLLLNGVVTGLLLALPALALTLTFCVLKFPNFSIGAMLTLGAYAAWFCNTSAGLPLAAAASCAVVAVAVAAVLVDRTVYTRLRDRGPITLLVASMGVSFVLENICRFCFGNDARNFDVAVARPIRWHGLRINHEQIITAITVAAALLVLHVVLRHTPLGRAMRAVADNAPLAAVRGIERELIVGVTWAISGALAAIAAVLAGLDRAIDPLIGWNYQISIFAAAILGGLGSPTGAVAGALLIGIAEEVSTLVIPTNYRQAVSFAVILVLLLFRSNGLLGQKAIRK